MKKIIYISGLITSCLILNSDKLNAQVYFGTNTVSATGTAVGTGNTSNSLLLQVRIHKLQMFGVLLMDLVVNHLDRYLHQ